MKLLRKIHRDLVHRVFCSPTTGLIGTCEPDQPTLARFGLGQHPVCRYCKRQTRHPLDVTRAG